MTTARTKPWWQSLTFWSLILAAVGQVLSQSGYPTLGSILTAAGSVSAMYGRVRAGGPLTRT